MVKRIFAVLILFFSINISGYTQEDTTSELSGKLLSLKLGFEYNRVTFSDRYELMIPPLSLTYEKFHKNNISLGLFIGIGGGRYDLNNIGVVGNRGRYAPGYWLDWIEDADPEERFTDLFIGMTGSYHFGPLMEMDPKWDIYAGLMLITAIEFYSTQGNSSSPEFRAENGIRFPGAWAGFHAGARYYFNDDLAVLAEMGYGISVFQLGLTKRY